jgi:hypothetical protein
MMLTEAHIHVTILTQNKSLAMVQFQVAVSRLCKDWYRRNVVYGSKACHTIEHTCNGQGVAASRIHPLHSQTAEGLDPLFNIRCIQY